MKPTSNLRRPSSASGFTLMELLVVIAVIMILARILLPALSAARKKAQDVVCVNNLKQFGIAFAVYINDWKTYPSQNHNSADTNNLWMPAIAPYVQNNWNVFVCPLAQLEAQQNCSTANYNAFPNPWKPGQVMNSARWASYGYNDWGTNADTGCGFGGWQDTGADCCRKLDSVSGDSSRLFLLGDSTTDCNWDTAIDGNDPGPKWPSTRHFGAAFFLHADGHVERFKQSEVINTASGGTDPNWALRWNVNGYNGVGNPATTAKGKCGA